MAYVKLLISHTLSPAIDNTILLIQSMVKRVRLLNKITGTFLFFYVPTYLKYRIRVQDYTKMSILLFNDARHML